MRRLLRNPSAFRPCPPHSVCQRQSPVIFPLCNAAPHSPWSTVLELPQLLGNSASFVAASASEWFGNRPSASPFDRLRAPSGSRGWRSPPPPSQGFFPSGAKPFLRLGLHGSGSVPPSYSAPCVRSPRTPQASRRPSLPINRWEKRKEFSRAGSCGSMILTRSTRIACHTLPVTDGISRKTQPDRH